MCQEHSDYFKKLRQKKVKLLLPKTAKWWNEDSNSGRMTLEPNELTNPKKWVGGQ